MYTKTQELLAATQEQLKIVSYEREAEQDQAEYERFKKEKQDKAAKDEAEKVAATAKEAADKKQWLIGELEARLQQLYCLFETEQHKNRELEEENARFAAHYHVLENTVNESLKQLETISQGYDAMQEHWQEMAQSQCAHQTAAQETPSLQQGAALYSPSLQRFLARLKQANAASAVSATSHLSPTSHKAE